MREEKAVGPTNPTKHENSLGLGYRGLEGQGRRGEERDQHLGAGALCWPYGCRSQPALSIPDPREGSQLDGAVRPNSLTC